MRCKSTTISMNSMRCQSMTISMRSYFPWMTPSWSTTIHRSRSFLQNGYMPCTWSTNSPVQPSMLATYYKVATCHIREHCFFPSPLLPLDGTICLPWNYYGLYLSSNVYSGRTQQCPDTYCFPSQVRQRKQRANIVIKTVRGLLSWLLIARSSYMLQLWRVSPWPNLQYNTVHIYAQVWGSSDFVYRCTHRVHQPKWYKLPPSATNLP
jgi:hypothetical protein